MDHLLPWLRLQFTPGLGRAGLIRLIEHYGTPKSALDAAEEGWSRMLASSWTEWVAGCSPSGMMVIRMS
jgi:hypothetical protein